MCKDLYFLILIFLVAVQSATFQPALCYNENIFTSDLHHPFIGYFILENGIISEIGDTLSAERISPFTNKVDFQRKTVIPGIVDSHIHFIDGSQ